MKNKLYGNNIVISFFGRKFVIGIKRDVNLVIWMSLAYISYFIIWMILYISFYNYIYIIFQFCFFIIMFYNYLMCFLKEPGIIPRRCVQFKITAKIPATGLTSENNIFDANNQIKLKDRPNSNELEIISNIKLSNLNKSKIHEPKKIISIFPEANEETSSNSKKQNELNNSLIFVKDDVITSENITQINNIEGNASNNNVGYCKEKMEFGTHIKKGQSVLPLIFQEKICSTCMIMRPPKASHCKICDNCILNLDHHCFFISNCVGERNHKNFVSFLLTGSIISVSSFIAVIYHLYFIIVKFKWELTKQIFKSNPIVIILSLILIVISSGLYFYKKVKKVYLIPPFAIGQLGIAIMFYIKLVKLKDFKFRLYYHPFGFTMFFSILPLMTFVVNNFYKQFTVLGKGLTIKQLRSIIKEKDELVKKNKSSEVMDMYLKKRISIGNFIMFIRRRQKKSLIKNYI